MNNIYKKSKKNRAKPVSAYDRALSRANITRQQMRDPVSVGREMQKRRIRLGLCFMLRDRFFASRGVWPEDDRVLEEDIFYYAYYGIDRKGWLNYYLPLMALKHGIIEGSDDPRKPNPKRMANLLQKASSLQ